jgi:hypothetical protein
MRRTLALVALAFLVPGASCGSGDGPAGACDPAIEACDLVADVSTTTVGPGVEDEDRCQSWTLNNPTELWINGVSETNGGAYHHANWFFVPDNLFPQPDGVWSCSAAGFSELNAALYGGYLFALSTQSRGEDQTLPVGSGIRIPPYSRIIGASHLLNASDVAVTTTLHLELHTIPLAQVKAKMVPSRIQYHDLKIDPLAKSAFTTECLFGDKYQDIIGKPFAYKLHFAISHYHQLGTYTQLEIAGGPRDGEVLFRHDGYGENLGITFDPPLDLAAAGAHGVRWTCGYTNPRDAKVGWGIGDQEMCVVALQGETEMAFDGDVGAGAGAPSGVRPDGEIGYQGPCSLIQFPWDFNQAGGPPR